MRIDEGEGHVRGQRDPLSRRRERLGAAGGSKPGRAGEGDEPVNVERCFSRIGKTFQTCTKLVGLAGLDETEMALRKDKIGIAGHCPENRQSDGEDWVAGVIEQACDAQVTREIGARQRPTIQVTRPIARRTLPPIVVLTPQPTKPRTE